MLFAVIAVWLNRRRNREFMPYVVGVLCTIASFFLIVLLFADVNPYERLGFTPANGQGLNPQLQNYWMTIHPPTLYLGFTAFTIPFAFAIAALLSGRLDSALDHAHPQVDAALVVFPVERGHLRDALGVHGAGVGRILVLGSGGERVSAPVAVGHRPSSTPSRSRRTAGCSRCGT